MQILILSLIVLAAAIQIANAAPKSNIILIFTDDQGYHDLGCYGATKIKTPNLDRMAAEGLRLTSFYAQPVCGVSRAALIGKWHQATKGEGPGGYDPATMPIAKGFDYYYGTPLFSGFTVRVDDVKVRSPIFRNQAIVVSAVESWDHITGDYTREALYWIERNHAQPFFLCLAHSMPHTLLGASENFKSKSAYSAYGDAIEEIDWSAGQILAKLKQLGLDSNNIGIYTSDDGPWIEAATGDGIPFIPRNHSGSADPLRGAKMTGWDGGCRVPFIARWPGEISAGGTSDQILSTMDLFPTFAALGGAALPDRTLDGRNAVDLLLGKTPMSQRDEYLYCAATRLAGVRSGRWRLELPRPANAAETGWWGRFRDAIPAIRLYDLDADPGEASDVVAQHPGVVAELMQRVERARTELGDYDRIGSGARFFDDGPRRPDMKKAPKTNHNKNA